jgi:hypothetical protein
VILFYTSDDERPANAHWKYRIKVADTDHMTKKVFLLFTFTLKNSMLFPRLRSEKVAPAGQ